MAYEKQCISDRPRGKRKLRDAFTFQLCYNKSVIFEKTGKDHTLFKELHGDPVKKEIEDYIIRSVKNYVDKGVVPKLAVIRAGDDSGQIYYENAILRQS
jgi:hypothetical protein